MQVIAHYVTMISLIGITFFLLLHAIWAYQRNPEEDTKNALPPLRSPISEDCLRSHIEHIEEKLEDQSRWIKRVENKLIGTGAIVWAFLGAMVCLYLILIKKNDWGAEDLGMLALFASFGIYGLVKVFRS
jgi:hypothetical protein